MGTVKGELPPDIQVEKFCGQVAVGIGGRIEILAGDGDVLVDSDESGGDHPGSEYKEQTFRHPALRNHARRRSSTRN